MNGIVCKIFRSWCRYNFKGFSRSDEIFSRRVTASENVFKIFQHADEETIVCIVINEEKGLSNYYSKVELTSSERYLKESALSFYCLNGR